MFCFSDNIEPNRRGFQDPPDFDDFFTPSFATRRPFTDPLLNRFGQANTIRPRSTLSPNRFSPGTSPKVSNLSRRQEPQEVVIPVNYQKSPSNFVERENSEPKELPFTRYTRPAEQQSSN